MLLKALRMNPFRKDPERMASTALDCLIIGAGPAGLTAAIYLARFRRRFLVLHDDASRAEWIPKSHNHPGFPDGIAGPDLLQRMRLQAARYGAVTRSAQVLTLARRESGMFLATLADEQIEARTILLATGVMDLEPNLPDLADGVRRGLIRHCGICDGYEVMGRKVAVIGSGAAGLKEALFLQTYTKDITLLSSGKPMGFTAAEQRDVAAANVQIIDKPVSSARIHEHQVNMSTSDGVEHRFDVLYSALGTMVRSKLAASLGAVLDERQCIITDDHQQSSIPRLYAAGDVTRGLDQICVATGQAAIAATAIHNSLG
jgi:thioredoxin reductase (NADPH)